MALYAEIISLTTPNPYNIMTFFEIRDNTPDPDEVIMSGSHGFSIFIEDANGGEIPETPGEKQARYFAEFNAYVDRLMRGTNLVAQYFGTLQSNAIGYQYTP